MRGSEDTKTTICSFACFAPDIRMFMSMDHVAVAHLFELKFALSEDGGVSHDLFREVVRRISR